MTPCVVGRALAIAVVIGLPNLAGAQERIEGTVISTKLTTCDFKPGTYEVTLVLDTGGKGAPGPIKAPKGTHIMKGRDHLSLPGRKGRRRGIRRPDADG